MLCSPISGRRVAKVAGHVVYVAKNVTNPACHVRIANPETSSVMGMGPSPTGRTKESGKRRRLESSIFAAVGADCLPLYLRVGRQS